MSRIEGPRPQITSRELIRGFPKDLIKNLEIITLEPKDDIERKIALIEDAYGHKASIYVYSNAPAPRDDMKYVFPSFKEHTHVGGIEFLDHTKVATVDSADLISVKRIKDISAAIERSPLKEDKNYLISGMSALVIPDSEDSESTNNSDMQKAIGYLFSEKGPFNKTLVLSRNDEQRQNLIDGGAQLLLPPTDGFNVDSSNPDFTLFVSRFADKFKNEDIFPFFVVLATYLRWSLDIYNLGELDGFGYGKDLKEFLKVQTDLFFRQTSKILFDEP